MDVFPNNSPHGLTPIPTRYAFELKVLFQSLVLSYCNWGFKYCQ